MIFRSTKYERSVSSLSFFDSWPLGFDFGSKWLGPYAVAYPNRTGRLKKSRSWTVGYCDNAARMFLPALLAGQSQTNVRVSTLRLGAVNTIHGRFMTGDDLHSTTIV